jgi:hypothetical protein
MGVAAIQAVISAWRSFGRAGRWSGRWDSTFDQKERVVERDQAKQKARIAADDRGLFAYTQEQIRGLVHQTFLSGSSRPLRQIIFAGIDKDAAISELCLRVATVLAEEVQSDVCLVGHGEANRNSDHVKPGAPFRQGAAQPPSERISSNLWRIPAKLLWDSGADTSDKFGQQLEALNREFEFSVIEGPAVCAHAGALAMGRCCDGVVLALEAGLTHRVAAQKAKEVLTACGANLLGTVLCNRSFPIPEAIYRRV